MFQSAYTVNLFQIFIYIFGGVGGGELFQFCCCWLVSFICYSDKTIFATGIACMLLSLWRHGSSNLVTESSRVPENDFKKRKKKEKEKKGPLLPSVDWY